MLLSAPWVNKSQQVTNSYFYLHENQERKNHFQSKGFVFSPPASKKNLIKLLKWPTELTSNLLPKPGGMMEEEKGLVNQPMVINVPVMT